MKPFPEGSGAHTEARVQLCSVAVPVVVAAVVAGPEMVELGVTTYAPEMETMAGPIQIVMVMVGEAGREPLEHFLYSPGPVVVAVEEGVESSLICPLVVRYHSPCDRGGPVVPEELVAEMVVPAIRVRHRLFEDTIRGGEVYGYFG